MAAPPATPLEDKFRAEKSSWGDAAEKKGGPPCVLVLAVAGSLSAYSDPNALRGRLFSLSDRGASLPHWECGTSGVDWD